MAVLTLARFIAITDAFAAALLAAKGASTNGLGDNDVQEPGDDVGARGRLGDLNGVLLGYGEDDYIDLADAVKDAIATAGYQTWAERVLSNPLGALDDLCSDAGLTGVTNITSFASYYNYGAGGPWLGLLAPDFGRGVYRLVNGSNLEARNVYSPAVSNMGSRAFGASFVDGTAIDATKYAGAAVLNAVVSSHAGTSGTAVLLGNGRNSAGATVTGRTWTATITGDGTVAWTPANTGDICTDVTGLTLPGTMSAGTIQVAAAIPGGRSNPPT